MEIEFVNQKNKNSAVELNNVKFEAEYGENIILPDKKKAYIGMGKDKMSNEQIKFLGILTGQISREQNEDEITINIKEADDKWVREITFGVYFSNYNYTFKTKDKNKKPQIKQVKFIINGKDKNEDTEIKNVCEAVNAVREMGDMPSNMKTPDLFLKSVKRIFDKETITLNTIEHDKLKELGMNGIIAVGQGSKHPPKLIIAEYGKEFIDNGTYALVGKGITFDSGGISIKPSRNMHEMKYDMLGAATVFGSILAIAKNKVKKHIVAVAGIAENMPDGNAQRPGDIITMYNKKTVEVLNTDAEGRLVLGDALAYTEKTFNPKHIINFATLTGAVVVALGHRCAGVMGNDQKLINEVIKASNESGDRCWELPLWDDYFENIESKIADFANVGTTPPGAAGTITAGIFLKQFVDKVPWVHIDIAGTGWYDKKKPFAHSGPSGFGVRLMYELLTS